MDQLPLLATLKGNDFLNYKELEYFHRNLMRTDKYIPPVKVFPKIADFIRRKGVDMNLKEFAKRYLKDQNRAKVMQVHY